MRTLPRLLTASQIKEQLHISGFLWAVLRRELTPIVLGKRNERYNVEDVNALLDRHLRPRAYRAGKFDNRETAEMFGMN
jgi:hypothetical protein